MDVVNGIVGGSGALIGLPSPAEVVRGGILLWALLVLLRVVTPALRKLQVWVIVLGALGSAGLVLTYFMDGNIQHLIGNVTQLSKVLYGPALVLLLVVLTRRYRLDLPETLDAVSWVAGVAGGSIVLFTITGLGRATYRAYDLGSRGLFISQNDIGVAMGVGLIAAFYMLLRTRRIRYAVLTALGLAGMLMLGTRAAMLAAFVIPVAMLVINRSLLVPGRRGAFIGVILGAGILAALSVAGAWEYRNIQVERFQQVKLQRLSEDPFVRGIRVLAAVDYVARRPTLAAVTGEGMVSYGQGVARSLEVNADYVLAEVDWMDMFGAYGIFFTIAIYSYYIRFLSLARRLRPVWGKPVCHTMMLSVAWFLFHSIVAGHALAGTIPAGALAPVLSIIWVGSGKSPAVEVNVG